MTNGTVSFVYALRIGERPVCRASPLSGLGPMTGGTVFPKVVKTAQSRERTERTLLTALSQLLWPDKGREVWFSLGENHEKACRKLQNCLRGDSCSPQAPSRSIGILRKGFIRRF